MFSNPVSSSFVVPLYKLILNATHRRGFHTLGKINAKLFHGGMVHSLPSGTTLFVPADPHFFGYFLGHDHHIAERMLQSIAPGDLCVDVGANIGFFTLLMAGLVGKSGSVMAFEPEEANFQTLQMNSSMSGSSGDGNIAPFKMAISANDGILGLEKGEFSTYHKVRTIVDSSDSDSAVQCRRLDSLFTELDERRNVSVLKVDVEGHELDVLAGCEGLLAQGKIQSLVTEFHPRTEYSGMKSFISKWGRSAEFWDGSKWSQFREGIRSRTDLWISCVN
jgi:FkbM family methyltransferase